MAVIVVAAGLWAGAAKGCPLIGDPAGLCGLSAEVFWCGRVSGCRPLAQCGFGAEPSDAARQGLRRLPLLGDRYGSPRCVAVLVGAYRLGGPGRASGIAARPPVARRPLADLCRQPAPRRNALPPDERTHSIIMDQPIIPGTPKATVSRNVADHPSSWIGDGSLVEACTVTGSRGAEISRPRFDHPRC